MSTQTIESPVQWQAITDYDAIEAAKQIKQAHTDLINAQDAYNQKLLLTPSIWKSRSKDSDIADASGVGKQMIGIYRRVGRILGVCAPLSVTPEQVATQINWCFNHGGLVKVDQVLDEYNINADEPTWDGAVAALIKVFGKPGNAKLEKPAKATKSDDEKVDALIKNLVKFSDKGYSLSDEQRKVLASLK
jgi:hypothetical protein